MLRTLRLNPHRNPHLTQQEVDVLAKFRSGMIPVRSLPRSSSDEGRIILSLLMRGMLTEVTVEDADGEEDETFMRITPLGSQSFRMNPRRNFDPMAYARQCVEDAIVLQKEHGSLMDALQSFRKGQLVETLREHGFTDRATLAAADAEFNRELNRRLGV